MMKRLGLVGVLLSSAAFAQTQPGMSGGIPTSTMPLPGTPGWSPIGGKVLIEGKEVTWPWREGASAPVVEHGAIMTAGVGGGTESRGEQQGGVVVAMRPELEMQFQFEPKRPEMRVQTAGIRTVAEATKAKAWEVPEDWTDYNFLVIEWRASTSQRFQLELIANDGEGGKEVMVAKRIDPFQGAWVRAAIPLEYFRKPAREGFDLAATFNKHRDAYFININFGGWAPCRKVTGIGFQMDNPIASGGKAPTLEIRSVKLAKADPGDAVLEPKVVVDAFGQWVPAEWPGKAKSIEDLKKAWTAEDAALKPGDFGYDKFGGYAATNGKATGFFHVEQQKAGQYWFVDPEGHLFYSTGVNGIGTGYSTPTANRQDIFASLTAEAAGGTGRGPGGTSNFYLRNLQQRFGANVNAGWGQLTARRMDAWGFNTVAGFASGPNASIVLNGNRKPYTAMLRWTGGGGGGSGSQRAIADVSTVIMGMPSVYAPNFAANIDQRAQQMCDPLKDDLYLLGYFVGNEPPWPGRESLFCDAVLAGPDTTMRERLQGYLAQGDTPERRKKFVYDAFDVYLSTIVAAIKKYDPNHLTLGIRLGGEVPDEVIKACRVFDVCSINVYDFAIDTKFLDKVANITNRPIVVGEFHFGTPERGLAGGLRQVATQKDRGLAYAYYVEHAAAHPNVIGTHWFQWIDQPATGRNDGENYNIGLIDVTDQPYADLVSGMAAAHKRIFDVHFGKLPPTDKMPEGRSTAEIQLEHPVMIPATQ